MIDALLFSVRDAIRGAGFGYGVPQCDTMPTGKPKPGMGNLFVAVHQGASKSDMDNALDEYFGFRVTLTMRVNVPWDRVGDQLLAVETARETGFNRRCEQLRAFLHMNWGVLQDANNYLVTLSPDASVVYGFCEPARYRGMEQATFQTGEWFASEEGEDVGLKSELTFEDARRLQPIAQYV